ncbi:MAG: hypothetical protein R2827_06415 [Bdellovibrionales bacterium]
MSVLSSANCAAFMEFRKLQEVEKCEKIISPSISQTHTNKLFEYYKMLDLEQKTSFYLILQKVL